MPLRLVGLHGHQKTHACNAQRVVTEHLAFLFLHRTSRAAQRCVEIVNALSMQKAIISQKHSLSSFFFFLNRYQYPFRSIAYLVLHCVVSRDLSEEILAEKEKLSSDTIAVLAEGLVRGIGQVLQQYAQGETVLEDGQDRQGFVPWKKSPEREREKIKEEDPDVWMKRSTLIQFLRCREFEEYCTIFHVELSRGE